MLSSYSALEVQSFLNETEDKRAKLRKSDGLMVAAGAGK